MLQTQDTPSNGQEIALPFSKAVLASRLNLTPEHFSRILHDLMESQLINVSGKNIAVMNIEKLRNYEG